jgi:hypothetical protein
VSQLRQHPLEPLRLPAGFDAHSYGPFQAGVKGPHLLLSFVTQCLLYHLSGPLVQHRDLLIARMKIAAYNLHVRLLSPVLVAEHAKSTRVQGADVVMKSIMRESRVSPQNLNPEVQLTSHFLAHLL